MTINRKHVINKADLINPGGNDLISNLANVPPSNRSPNGTHAFPIYSVKSIKKFRTGSPSGAL